MPPNTHPPLGGIINHESTGGIVNDTATGGAVAYSAAILETTLGSGTHLGSSLFLGGRAVLTTSQRGGRVTESARGGVVLVPVVSGTVD